MMSIISYLKKLLFVGLVTGATMSMVYAGTGATVTRGSVPATPITWSVSSAGSGCFGSTSYPLSSDNIRSNWGGLKNNSGTQSFPNVTAAAGTYTFDCVVRTIDNPACPGDKSGPQYVCWDSAVLTVKDCPSSTSWNSNTLTCDPWICTPNQPTSNGCPSISLSNNTRQCSADGLSVIGPVSSCTVTSCTGGAIMANGSCTCPSSLNNIGGACVSPSVSYFNSTGCTIANSASTCQITLSWGAINSSGVYVTDGNGNLIASGLGTTGTYNVNVGPGSYTYRLYDSNTNVLLGSTPVSGSGALTVGCTSSSSAWNGSTCQPVICTANAVVSSGCTQPSNGIASHTCNSTGTGYVGNCATTGCSSGYTLIGGKCVANACPNGAIDNPSPCQQCPNGQYWNGTACANCGGVVGGCTSPTGTGGSAGNPYGDLKCANGASDVPTCTAKPTISSFSAGSNSTVDYGQSATLTYTSSGGTCTINGIAVSGGTYTTAPLTAGSNTFVLVCSNSGGPSSKTINVLVAAGGFTSPVSGSIASCVINRGAGNCQMNLSWDSSNMTAPTIKNDTTNQLISSQPTGTNIPVTFTTFGNNIVTIRNGSFVDASVTINVKCNGTDIWSSGVCVAPTCANGAQDVGTCLQCPNGNFYDGSGKICKPCGGLGCDGTGGITSSGNSNGSLYCINGATNVPFCSQCPASLYWNGAAVACQSCGGVGECTGTTGGSSGNPYGNLQCANGGTVPNCAQCPNGQYWNGTACANCGGVVGGCTSPTGTGGSAGNPYGDLKCANGASDVPTCTAKPTISSFSAGSNSTVDYGQSATLTYTSSGGTCTINGISVSGGTYTTAPLTAGSNTFTLSCTNSGGNTSKDVTVLVAAGQFTSPTSGSTVTCNIARSATNCQLSISWNSSNMTAPKIINDTTGAPISTSANGNNVLVNFTTYGINKVTILNGSFPDASIYVKVHCTGDDIWVVGTGCKYPTGSFTNTGSIKCDIAMKGNTCSATFNWDTTDIYNGARLETCTDSTLITNINTAHAQSFTATLPYSPAPGTCYRLVANTDGAPAILDTVNVIADCDSSKNLVWSTIAPNANTCKKSLCDNGCTNASDCNTATSKNYFPMPTDKCIAPSGKFNNPIPTCSISVDDYKCNVTLNWENDNGVARLEDCGGGLYTSVSAGPDSKVITNTIVTLPYGGGCYRLVDIGTGLPLDTANLPSPSCANGSEWSASDNKCSTKLSITAPDVNRYFGLPYTLAWTTNANSVAISYNGTQMGTDIVGSNTYDITGLAADNQPPLTDTSNILTYSLLAKRAGQTSVSGLVKVNLKYKAVANIDDPTMNNGIVKLGYGCKYATHYTLSDGNNNVLADGPADKTSSFLYNYTCQLNSCPSTFKLFCNSDAASTITKNIDKNSLKAHVSNFSITPSTLDKNSVNNQITISWGLTNVDSCHVIVSTDGSAPTASDIAEAASINAKILASATLNGVSTSKSKDATPGTNVLTGITITSSKVFTMICGDTKKPDGTWNNTPFGIYAGDTSATKSIKLNISTTKEQ